MTQTKTSLLAASVFLALTGSAAKAETSAAIPEPVAAPAVERQYDYQPMYNWKHSALKAADGTNIVLEFSAASLANEVIANPVNLRIYNYRKFSGRESVRAVVLTLQDNEGRTYLIDTKTVDLRFRYNEFTATLRNVLMGRDGNAFRHEIAVVVDGKWLVDPVNGSNNFRFSMHR